MSFTDAKSYSVQQNDRVGLSHQKVNDLDGWNLLPIDVILMCVFLNSDHELTVLEPPMFSAVLVTIY